MARARVPLRGRVLGQGIVCRGGDRFDGAQLGIDGRAHGGDVREPVADRLRVALATNHISRRRGQSGAVQPLTGERAIGQGPLSEVDIVQAPSEVCRSFEGGYGYLGGGACNPRRGGRRAGGRLEPR
jgi:hypothetical protein